VAAAGFSASCLSDPATPTAQSGPSTASTIQSANGAACVGCLIGPIEAERSSRDRRDSLVWRFNAHGLPAQHVLELERLGQDEPRAWVTLNGELLLTPEGITNGRGPWRYEVDLEGAGELEVVLAGKAGTGIRVSLFECYDPRLRTWRGEGVTGSPASGDRPVECGDRVSYSFSPAAGFNVPEVFVNGDKRPTTGRVRITSPTVLSAMALQSSRTVPPQGSNVANAIRDALRTPTQQAFQSMVDAMATYAESFPTNAISDLHAILNASVNPATDSASIVALDDAMRGREYAVSFPSQSNPPGASYNRTLSIGTQAPAAAQPAPTRVMFINGIWKTSLEAALDGMELGLVVKEAQLPGTRTGGIYNKSWRDPTSAPGLHAACALRNALGVWAAAFGAWYSAAATICALTYVGDFAQSVYQVFGQAVNQAPPASESIVVRDILEGHLSQGTRVIAVGHSQGNLMIHEALNKHTIPTNLRARLGVISVAAPAPAVPSSTSIGAFECWVVRGDVIDAVPMLLQTVSRAFMLGQAGFPTTNCASPRLTTELTDEIGSFFATFCKPSNRITGGTTCIDPLIGHPVTSAFELHDFGVSYLGKGNPGSASPQAVRARVRMKRALIAQHSALQGGDLGVAVNGLPGGVLGDVSVTGPFGFNATVTSTVVLGALPPGAYTVLARHVQAGATACAPAAASQTVVVVPLAAVSAVVEYTCAGGGAQFTDDFSAGLGSWIVRDPDNLGSWSIQNGELIGDYNIVCGSPGCNQTQLLLASQFQPAAGDWRIEVQSGLVEAYCCFNGGAMVNLAKFALWVSDSEKEIFEVGAGWQGLVAPASSDSAYVYHQRYPWQPVGFVNRPVSRWFPSQWQTAALEKRGNQYTVYWNGDALYTVTRAFSSSPKVGLQTYGKVRMDNFKLFIMP
jgi:hypothetical protein